MVPLGKSTLLWLGRLGGTSAIWKRTGRSCDELSGRASLRPSSYDCTLIDVDYSSIASQYQELIKKEESDENEVLEESKLDQRVHDQMAVICNLQAMEKTVLDLECDSARTRLANTIFIVLSPREFLDRARINTIKKYQVFFSVPFVEFHPTISRMDVLENEIPSNPQEARDQTLNRLRDVHPPKRKRPLIVQKDNGRFDSQDYSVVCLYGSDYVALRSKLTDKHSDLISMFLNQCDIHVLRAIEPTLRIRYHQRTCEADLDAAEFARCTSSKREGLASKDQLARLLFHEE